MPKLKLVKVEKPMFCGFCGRYEDESALLLGPKPYVCDRCIALCVGLIIEKLPADHKSVVEIISRVAGLTKRASDPASPQSDCDCRTSSI